MKKIGVQLRSGAGLIALALGTVCVTPSDAWAYVDPGTGSYLFQLAAAGLLAGMYTLRKYWYALTGALRQRPAAGASAPPKRPNDME